MSTESMHGTARAGLPKLAIVALAGLLVAGPSWTQVPVDEEGNPIDAEPVGDAQAEAVAPAGENLTVAELEELVGPIALYPDDLLAVVLPASAYPLQIVQAARFLEEREQNEALEPDESWEDSVVALLNYPEVIEMMNEDLEWTYALGEAVVRQQADVIAAIEAFRDRAYAAGNLKTDERQTVTRENGVVQIEPADETVIYVPYYEPERVVVYQPEPVYHYYSRPYPVYYYPYPHGYSFASGYFWGVTTAFHIRWLTDHVHVLHHSYWGHPYFGHTYFFGHWYRRPTIHVHNRFFVNNHVRRPPHHHRDGDFWRPRRHSGGVIDRRAVRNAYYTDRRGRASPEYRHTQRILTNGPRVDRDDTTSRTRQSRDAEQRAGFARNRSDAAVRDRERTRESAAERRRTANSASSERDEAIRFRARPDTVRRATDGDGIRFRARERAAIDASRQPSLRAAPERRTVERPSSRRAAPQPERRERPAIRRDSEPARRAAPPGRSIERERISRPSSSFSRATPRISRPSSESRPSPRISRPSSTSRSSPRISRPSSESRSSPRINRPSSESRSSPRISRPSNESRSSSRISRPSSESRASPRISRPSSESRSAPRRSHRQ